MFRPDLNWVRLGMMSLAGILGLGAAWILAVQFIRPTVPFFPDDAASSQAAAAHRGAAGAAAWIGLIRGDLWTDYAITLAPDLSKEFTGDRLATSLQARQSVQAAAVRAVELAPFEARSWLLLADVNSRALDHKVAGFLKMSYYTGPNALSLIPMRINIATRTDAISDPELQILVAGEIRTIITRRPDLKALILAAYRNATPEGKRFIEAQVAELDTGLLASLRATNTSR
jgi:hypothetical protein